MKGLKAVLSFAASKKLSVWLLGLVAVYYMTISIWSKEAFGLFTTYITNNNLFRLLYIIFLLNLFLRTANRLKSLWPRKLIFFLRLPLLAGTVLLLFSFFASLNIREQKLLLVGVEDTITVPWDPMPFHVLNIRSALKERELRTDKSAIFAYEPAIMLEDMSGLRYEIGAFPPRKVRSTYMHVLNFGIGPGIELSKNNTVVSRGYMALLLTPFGRTDSFQIPFFPYKFYLTVLPNRLIKKGSETAREYELSMPRYKVEITVGDRLLVRNETDTGVTFDRNMKLTFFPPADWILLEAVYDPFLPLLVIALLLFVTGLVLYPITLFLLRNRKNE